MEIKSPLVRRLINIDEVHIMKKEGILRPDERIELISGMLFEKTIASPKLAACVKGLTALFYALLADKVTIGVQDPVHINDFSEPEPDISILHFSKDRYAKAHPEAKDVILLIEVAESSLDYDREVKLPLYAASGIPEVWVVNPEDNQMEIYTSPENESYQSREILTKEQKIYLPAFGLEIPVSQILI